MGRVYRNINSRILKMKKRKLNSKNPKYMDKSHITEEVIKEKKLINNVNGVKIYALWYEK